MMMDEHVVEYVSGLPAVKSVTNDRIRYTDEFKRRVAEGYRRGESPVAMWIGYNVLDSPMRDE